MEGRDAPYSSSDETTNSSDKNHKKELDTMADVFKEKIKGLIGENTKLKEELEIKTKNEAKYQSRINMLMQNNATMKNEVDAITAIENEYKGQLYDLNENNANLKIQLYTQEQCCCSYKRKLDLLQSHVSKLKGEKNGENRDEDNLKIQIKALMEENYNIKVKLHVATKTKGKAEKKLNLLKVENVKLRTQLDKVFSLNKNENSPEEHSNSVDI